MNIKRILVATLMALVVSQALADNEDTITFPNNTGKDVNDLHIKWDRAVDIKSVTVFKKKSGSGTNKSDFSKGTVEAGDSCDVTVTWDGTDPKVDSWYWTIDGKKVRDEKASDVNFCSGITLPSQIDSNAPFLFTASGTLSGQVISFETLEGEVVAKAPTDSRGRAYLAGGLATGLYMLVTGQGKRQIEVSPCPELPSVPGLSMGSVGPMKLGDAIRLPGQGIDPSSASALFQSASGAIPADIKAATPREITLGSPESMGLKPGSAGNFLVSDAKGSASTNLTMAYDAKAQLTRREIPGGSQTSLVVVCEPATMSVNVSAEIESGPVGFLGGSRSQTRPLKDGRVEFPIQSMPGSNGTFNVRWNIDWSSLAGPIAGNFLAQDSGLKDHWDRRADGTTWTQTDEKGRLVHEVKFDKDGNCLQDTTWEYDDHGRMRRKVTIRWNADGTVTEEVKTWDERNRPTGSSTETRDKDGKVQSGSKSTTTYDGKGNGTTTSQSYDAKTGTYK